MCDTSKRLKKNLKGAIHIRYGYILRIHIKYYAMYKCV